QVFVDPLTKIHNRRYFDVWAQQIAGKVAGPKTPLSLLLIDIDFFKQVNDRHGHPFGDAVLQRVAATILQCIPQPSHFAVRLGGEEFAVVLPNTDETTALMVSNRLRESVRQTATEMLPAHTVATGDAITISVGIATWLPGTALNVDRMLSNADRALYEAKHKGRNQSVLSRYQEAASTV
ncbi:MAG: GGDEF domain-containing protein, partial [Burkholderiales bacterium]|nr:GGDEF domain-containing protein [Burkholderiales bacterium]